MRESEVRHRGRYLAKVGGQRTIVRAYLTRRGWMFSDERTWRAVNIKSARRLWRPVLDCERPDSFSVRLFSYDEQRKSWDGRDVALPAVLDVGSRSKPARCCRRNEAAALRRWARRETWRAVLATAGC